MNVVPHSYAPNVENNEQLQQMFETHFGQESFNIEEATSQRAPVVPPLTPERKQLLFSKINLKGTKDWNDDLKCHTSLVKHKIKLDNYTPFKE